MSEPAQSKLGLGSRVQTGISDAQPQVNPYLQGTGWDVIFAPADLNFYEDEAEVYHIYLDGPVGSAVAVLVDGRFWDYVPQGWQNGWDPQQPLLLNSGNSLAFCWNTAFQAGPYDPTGTPKVQPTVTVWLRRPRREAPVIM